MTPYTLANILHLADTEKPVPDIATACDVSESTVYGVLRKHRPERDRSSRRQSSDKRPMIVGLLAARIPAARVALLTQCTRAWVYAIKKEQRRGRPRKVKETPCT